MASTYTSKRSLNEDINDGTIEKSYFQKTVCLNEWWLVKADKDFEGKRLAVGGITSREKQAVRTFSSAPILKRYDVFTLETVDGICVIIQGFMIKARSEENGFPSEVCRHFVFGFPSYWEICARKFSEGDCTPMGDARSNQDVERLSPQAAMPKGSGKDMTKNFDKACSEAETREYSNKKNLGVKSRSKSGKKETTYNSKDEESKSAFGSIAYGASERETSFSNFSVENRKNLELLGNHFNYSTAQPLTPSGLDENSDPLSAYHLTNVRGCNNVVQSLEDSSKKLAKRIFFSREADLSEEISSYSEGSGTTCSQKKVQGKFKNNQTSCGTSKDKKIKSVSVSLRGSDAVGNPRANLDNTPRGKSTLNRPGTEFQELTHQMTSRNPDARSFEDNVELDHGICLTGKDAEHDQNNDGVQENGGMQYKSDGCISLSGAYGEKEKRKKKISNSEKGNSPSDSLIPRKSRRKFLCNSQSENLFSQKSKRKLDSPVSQKEKKEASVISPESLHLRRSRSGRWLLPSLEFWRNQVVIYDADHQIMGIKDQN